MSASPKHHIVEVYLPLASNGGEPYGRNVFEGIRDELAERFGGVTFFSRSPAEGLWEDGDKGGETRDEIIVVEVLVERLDPAWWGDYRRQLEDRLSQEEILIRAHPVLRL